MNKNFPISPTLARARANFERVIHSGRRHRGQSINTMETKVAKAQAKRIWRQERNKLNWSLQQANYYFVN